MEFFEKKGVVKILLELYQDQEKPYSKYELEKKTNLSKKTLYKRLDQLLERGLITEEADIGPRNRTDISLTEKGLKVSSHLQKIHESLRWESKWQNSFFCPPRNRV